MAAKGTDMAHVVHWRRMVSRREAWRYLIIVAMLGALTGGLTGCSHSLTAQSSCKDFLNASQSDQIQAIDKSRLRKTHPTQPPRSACPISATCAPAALTRHSAGR